MMRAMLSAVALTIAGGAAYAEPADKGIQALDLCIQASHLANSICTNATGDLAQWEECFQKHARPSSSVWSMFGQNCRLGHRRPKPRPAG